MYRARAGMSLAKLALVAALSAVVGCGDRTETEILSAAQQFMAKKDTESALLELKTLLQANPGSAQGRYLLAKLLHAAGEMPAAEAELRRALEAGQPEHDVLPLLARTMLAEGKGSLLLQQYGEANLADGQADAELKTHLSEAAAASGDLTKAAALLDQARRRASDPRLVDLQSARLAALRGDLGDALAQAQALITRQPDNADAITLKGDLLARPGPQVDLESAIVAWRQSLALKPENVGVHASVIAALIGKQDWSGANAQWAALKQVAPRHPQTQYFEALLAEHRGDFTRSREIAQQLLRRAPGDLRLLLLAGRAELRLGGLVQAETHFSKAMQAAPSAPAPRQSLAQVQLRNGQPDKALATLKPLLDATPPDVDAVLTAAYAHMQKGDSASASALYARAAQLSPTDVRVRTAAAIALLAKGQDVAAFKELQAIAAIDTGTVADLALINGKMQRGALDDALTAIGVLAAKTPDDPQPDHLRARVALQRKDVPAARRHFAQSLVRNPDYMPALMGLTTLDMMDKKPADAKARLEAVVQRNDKHVAAMLVLADLNDRTGGPSTESLRWLQAAVKAAPGDPAARVKLIDHLLLNNDLSPAMEATQAALAVAPAHIDLLDRMGRIQLLQGENGQAITTFHKMASLMPKSPLPFLRLADAQAASKDLVAAATSVRRALEISPEDPAVQRAAVHLAQAERKPGQALALARRLQLRDKVGGLLLEGEIESQQRNWPAAAAAFRKALSVAPTTETALRLHAVLLAAGKPAEAQELVVDWRKGHPDDHAFVIKLADAAMARRQPAQAEQLYREVLERRPDHLIVLNNLAYALAGQKKPGALAFAERAVKLAPDSAPFQDTLAFCLAAENQLARAIEVQTRAVDLAPAAPNFRLQLARLHLRAGDKDAAIIQLEMLEKLGAQYARHAEVLTLLKQARG